MNKESIIPKFDFSKHEKKNCGCVRAFFRRRKTSLYRVVTSSSENTINNTYVQFTSWMEQNKLCNNSKEWMAFMNFISERIKKFAGRGANDPMNNTELPQLKLTINTKCDHHVMAKLPNLKKKLPQ